MYDLYIMRRTQIYLDEDQAEQLAARAAVEGESLSAMIRRAIDALLAAGQSEAERLARFRDAVQSAAGAAPELPPGAAYVEQLRELDSDRERRLWATDEPDTQ